MRNIRHLLLWILALGQISVSGQKELPSGQIEVVKDFEVRLAETRKIRIIPQPPFTDTVHRQYEYRLLAPSPAIQYQVPEIKPLAMVQEARPILYPFYVKAGYGSPNSFLGALSFDHVQDEAWYWGLDLRHLSANHKEIPLQQFSGTRGRINSTYLIREKIRVDGHVDGRFETVYFYGADPIPSNPESLKRNFTRIDMRVSASGIHSPETDFHYQAFLNVLSDKDNLGSRESGIVLGGEVGSALKGGEIPFGLRMKFDDSKLRHTDEYALTNILAEPYLDYSIGRLELHLAGIALLRPRENEFLPRLEAIYNLTNPLLSFKAGWRGQVQKNNFHSLSAYNPFINNRLDSINNQIERRIYAGVSGVSGTLAFTMEGCYSRFKRMAFFLQDEDREEQFNPVYDNGSYIGIDASVRMEPLKYITLFASVAQRFFKLEQEDKPWHIPSLTLDGQVMYTGGGDQYHVSLLMHAENGLPFRTVGGTTARLDALLDLNIHGDYFITESLGAFTEINNILGNKRERWVRYPSVGFNVKAGIMLRIP